MLSHVFSGLSPLELAHVRRCQSIAQAEGLSVVSSGVLASPAAGAPAGAHFWLVGSPSSGAVSFVWLSASGRRLLCGCPRRRGGALSCAHAQAVRLWLLAAAGVAVPSLGAGAAAPVPAPVPPVSPSPAPSGAALPVPVAPPASCVSPAVVAAGPAVTGDVAADVPVCPCPGCGELAPVGVVVPFGVCASCLDLEAEAAGVAAPARCPAHPAFLVVGESASGPLCPLCAQLADWDSMHFTFEIVEA